MKFLTMLCSLFASLSLSGAEIPTSFAVVIIGGGPSGLACATACLKAGYPTLVCDEAKMGVLYPALPVTNWPGHAPMDWQKTLEELRKDFTRQGGVITYTHVKAITRNQGVFHISTDTAVFHAPAVVVATGRQPPTILPTITTEHPTRILSRLYDTSFLLPSDSAVIIGNSDYALLVASQVAPRIKRVFLFLQPPWKPTGAAIERITKKLPTIAWMSSERILSINSLKAKVIVEFLTKGSKSIQEASWVLFAEEWPPQSSLARRLTQCDSSGAILTYDDTGMTPSPGLFACGEVTSRGFLSGIAAAANGLQTSQAVCQFLLDHGPLPLPQMLPKEALQPPPPPAGTTGATGAEEPENVDQG